MNFQASRSHISLNIKNFVIFTTQYSQFSSYFGILFYHYGYQHKIVAILDLITHACQFISIFIRRLCIPRPSGEYFFILTPLRAIFSYFRYFPSLWPPVPKQGLFISFIAHVLGLYPFVLDCYEFPGLQEAYFGKYLAFFIFAPYRPNYLFLVCVFLHRYGNRYKNMDYLEALQHMFWVYIHLYQTFMDSQSLRLHVSKILSIF